LLIKYKFFNVIASIIFVIFCNFYCCWFYYFCNFFVTF
jgi:hypothetical protein